MSFLVGILTFLLLVNSLLLILLVLVQLPKKDAGAGLAFGGGAADALFGAGSGNTLTKITKWATGLFLVIAFLLGGLESRLHHAGSASEFEKQVEQQQQQTPVQMPASSAVPTTSQSSPAAMPLLSATNAPLPAPANGK
jgi:preprotein translocase subunit SecG